jgi:hypothetical protein
MAKESRKDIRRGSPRHHRHQEAVHHLQGLWVEPVFPETYTNS